MSLCLEGMDGEIHGGRVYIEVPEEHPLVMLGQSIPWEQLANLVLTDLRTSCAKGQYWKGRRLMVRIHLAVYILQQTYDWRDRETEQMIRYNGVMQIFCGKKLIRNWHVPDHSKIEEFRSRLTPETQRQLANYITKLAVHRYYACPKTIDQDSTVQQVNATLPSEVKIAVAITMVLQKVINFFIERAQKLQKGSLECVNFKEIKAMAKVYYLTAFTPENKALTLMRLKKEMEQAIEKAHALKHLPEEIFTNIPWNIMRAMETLRDKWSRVLMAMNHYIEQLEPMKGRILSLHLEDVAWFGKGRGNITNFTFGRNYQLARLKGNFLFAGRSDGARNSDRTAIEPMIEELQKSFGGEVISGYCADRGYYTKNNISYLKEGGISFYLPGPKDPLFPKSARDQYFNNHRAGVEAMIGVCKRGGQLKQSRMKKDSSTLASGYASILGVNLRQLMRKLPFAPEFRPLPQSYFEGLEFTIEEPDTSFLWG